MQAKYFSLLFMAIILNAAANIVLKWGVRDQPDLMGRGVTAALKALTGNVWVWTGVFLFGLAFILFSLLLTRVNLSVVYPVMTSMVVVVVCLVSYFAFKENITGLQAWGLLMIIAGVWLVSAPK